MAKPKARRIDQDPDRTLSIGTLDREELVRFGSILDARPTSLRGRTVAISLAELLLLVRTRDGWTAPLKANAVQRAFERRRGQRNIVLKARQMGLTTWTAGRFFLKTITQPGTLTLQVAHTRESAEEIFRIVRRFYDWLPEELRKGPLVTSRANVRQIAFPELDSQYLVVSAGDRNAGRGLTVQNLHCSELARWPGNPAETLAGLRASLSPTAEVILESTPDGVGGCFHQEWQNAAETGTVRHFFPWWLERRYRTTPADPSTVTSQEHDLIARHNLDLAQIAYRRQIHSGFRALAKQEFAEDEHSCFLASGESVFEISAIEDRLESAPPPLELRRSGELQIWLPPLPNRRYVIGVNPAGGGSEGDYSAAQILDLETGMQCAEFAAHLGGLELARFLAALATEYNHACLVVERNNHGAGILALLDSVCAWPHIFRQAGQPGWLTTSVTRPSVLARLGAALIENPEGFLSRSLLAECRSFVRLPNGNTGARPGTHDDRVLAMAIALAARAQLLESPLPSGPKPAHHHPPLADG